MQARLYQDKELRGCTEAQFEVQLLPLRKNTSSKRQSFHIIQGGKGAKQMTRAHATSMSQNLHPCAVVENLRCRKWSQGTEFALRINQSIKSFMYMQ